MQILKVNNDIKLPDLRKRMGPYTLDETLALNQIPYTNDIGAAMQGMYEYACSRTNNVPNSEKISILNSVSSEADVFESVALMDEDSWKYMSEYGTLPSSIRIPDFVEIPNGPDILGGSHVSISNNVYNEAIQFLKNGEPIDPVIFNTYSSIRSLPTQEPVGVTQSVSQWFNLPWGKITLYSSLSDTIMDFPVYPEDYDDGVIATYDTMPDMLYQYEPWLLYKGSGPRTPSLVFKMHRDMWTGDHRDGKCNELVRFCQAQCYPQYTGAAVNTAISTLYIEGHPYISGVITEEKHTYSGPIGLDGFPLVCELTLTFTEVAKMPLTYDTVRRKGLIE